MFAPLSGHLFACLVAGFSECATFLISLIYDVVNMLLYYLFSPPHNFVLISREFTHRVKSVSMSKFTSQEVEVLQNGVIR